MVDFDDRGFCNYYKNTSTYSKKEELVEDFFDVWWAKFDSRNYLKNSSWNTINDLWKAPNKKDLKVRLIAKGYSSQAIDALFKAMTAWLKATK